MQEQKGVKYDVYENDTKKLKQSKKEDDQWKDSDKNIAIDLQYCQQYCTHWKLMNQTESFTLIPKLITQVFESELVAECLFSHFHCIPSNM